jgi:hypothetical protein
MRYMSVIRKGEQPKTRGETTVTTTAEMMRKGQFQLVQTWTDDDDTKIEYWLGIFDNGACLRTINPDGTVTISHSNNPQTIIDTLARSGYTINIHQ